MKKTMRLLSMLLGIGGIVMLFLTPIIGFVMLLVAAGAALVSSFIEGEGGDGLWPGLR
jgi:hypothetical protein